MVIVIIAASRNAAQLVLPSAISISIGKNIVAPRAAMSKPITYPTGRRSNIGARLGERGGKCQANSFVIDITNLLYNISVMELANYSPPPNLDAVFSALADPTRRAILSRLAGGQASVTEIAEPFSISQPAVSRHLKVLESAGLVVRGIDEQRRPARLKAENMAAAFDWLTEFREFWGKSFEQLDDVLAAMKSTPVKDTDSE